MNFDTCFVIDNYLCIRIFYPTVCSVDFSVFPQEIRVTRSYTLKEYPGFPRISHLVSDVILKKVVRFIASVLLNLPAIILIKAGDLYEQ